MLLHIDSVIFVQKTTFYQDLIGDDESISWRTRAELIAQLIPIPGALTQSPMMKRFCIGV
jgi:hypothetical protein